MNLRVLVVDDQALVRRGFSLVLEHEGDIEVVAEAADGAAAIAAVREYQPDVVLMDIRMPGMDGLSATEQILSDPAIDPDGKIRVIVLTTFDPDEYIYRALRAGASGFLLKDTPPEDLVAAVRAVADGGALLSPTITRRLIGQFVHHNTEGSALAYRLDRLTERERQVLEAVGAGMNNQEIANALCIGLATVKTHLSSLLSKLGIRDRAQAVVFAYESGLLRPGDKTIGY